MIPKCIHNWVFQSTKSLLEDNFLFFTNVIISASRLRDGRDPVLAVLTGATSLLPWQLAQRPKIFPSFIEHLNACVFLSIQMFSFLRFNGLFALESKWRFTSTPTLMCGRRDRSGIWHLRKIFHQNAIPTTEVVLIASAVPASTRKQNTHIEFQFRQVLSPARVFQIFIQIHNYHNSINLETSIG